MDIYQQLEDNKKRFHQIYEENISKCFPPTSLSYPISQSNLMRWVDLMKEASIKYDDKCIYEFALQFAKNLTHISFDDFYQQLRKVCIDLLMILEGSDKSANEEGERGNKISILVIAGELNKSNTWVSLLVYNILKDKIKYVVSSKYCKKMYKLFPEAIFIHPDDCSYSGSQITSDLYVGQCSSIDDIKGIQYYITCPYVSNNAKETIQSTTPVKFLDSTVFFNSLRGNREEEERKRRENRDNERTECEMKMNTTVNLLFDNYKEDKELCTIYFDHKLADGASIFQKIIALGVYYTDDFKTIKNNIKGLIHNCEYDTSFLDLSKLNTYDLSSIYKNMCPPAFYKTINYTLGGETIKYLF